MKKIVSVKTIVMILISMLVITISANVYAFDPSQSANGDGGVQTVTPDDYQNNQKDETNNNDKKDDKNNNKDNTKLPQTGIEDYNVGILLVISVASAMYAYRKINDFREI